MVNAPKRAAEELAPYRLAFDKALGTLSVPRGERLLKIAIYGGTNTGKSALFNLLVNEEVSVSKVIASATRQPVIALSETIDLGVFSLGQLGRLSTIDETLLEPSSLADASYYLHRFHERCGPLGSGEGAELVALIDCPDHDSSNEMNRLVAEHLVNDFDRCIYLTTPQKYKTASARDALLFLASHGLKVGVLFNQLMPAQEAESLWHDLITTITDQDRTGGESSDQEISRLYLLGGLPHVKLKDSRERET